jgi:hypothetical protein
MGMSAAAAGRLPSHQGLDALGFGCRKRGFKSPTEIFYANNILLLTCQHQLPQALPGERLGRRGAEDSRTRPAGRPASHFGFNRDRRPWSRGRTPANEAGKNGGRGAAIAMGRCKRAPREASRSSDYRAVGGGGRLRDRGYRRDGRLFRHAIRKASERRGESDRLVAFTPRDGQKPRFGGNRDRFAPTGSAAWSIIILCRAPADIYFRRS